MIEQKEDALSLMHLRYRIVTDKLVRLEIAARSLRTAQKAYMTDRGNEELGKKVGEAAIELDNILADMER